MSTEKESVKKEVVKQTPRALAVETYYSREEIQATPSAFGVDAEVLAGALFGAEGDQLTRSQVTAAIEKFRKRKV
ncbi:oligoribonuclease [Sporosarcina sp. P12(2017)]|uniref:oligoribonuclease n=1 Tax=unclassified Sporosarcina TaxID=2647733 RepID=UPI000C573A06|nr:MULTISPECIES: oligoribonuclease [unclassified Sporosarcina]PIC59103.1 oligoribonuclease [Sporosarcina sp. P10]PIC62424.1 oligoribonuclease [Sporosarcina sp. P12(2017)]